MLIHGPNLVETVLVTLLKTLEFVLELLELLGKLFVVVSKLNVLSLEVLGLTVELLLYCAENILVASLLSLEGVDCRVVDLFTLL